MLPEYLVTNTPVEQYLEDLFNNNTYSKIGVLVDENTFIHCYPMIRNIQPHLVFEIQSGEIYKTLDTCRVIWDRMTENGFDRHSLLINLGGGVIGDMGGFCASTFKRGMQFINIPTTLLSQVDASIGGKLGIDYGAYKNHIGVFKDPFRVIIDERFLLTLPEKEVLSGYAEVIKHSLIADKEHWETLLEITPPLEDWKSIIHHSIQIKSEIVSKDPHESGLRKILNFGHTLGHAVESHFLDSEHPLLHGEAIAIGMIMEAYLSKKLAGLNAEDFENIRKYIINCYGKHKIGAGNYRTIYERTLQDKKNKGNKVWSVLLKGIAEPCDLELNEANIIEAIEFYDTISGDVY